MDGASSFTMIVTVAVALPPVLLAVTVYVALEEVVVGVPEMAPVEESIERPDGRDGETLQDVTAPPLEVGVTVVMAVFLTRESELGLYVMDEGAMSLTTMVTDAFVLPPVLLAVMV